MTRYRHQKHLLYSKAFLAFALSLLIFIAFSCEGPAILVLEGEEWLTYVTMERGAILYDGYDDASIDGYERWARTAFFVKTNGATELCLSEQIKRCRLVQFDENHCILSVRNINHTSRLDESCAYIRFSIFCSSVPPALGVHLLVSNTILEEITEEKRVQMAYPYDRLVYQVEGDVFTTALLMLPPNYSVDNAPVPLIIWDSGDGSFSNWNSYDCSTYEGRKKGIRYLRDQGFAVLEIYSWGSYYYKRFPGCGERSAMPIPTHLATHERGVEYVLNRYNIDPDHIFHISKSGSGKLSLYWAMFKPSFNLNAIFAFAPVFDDLTFVGWSMRDYRHALFEELNLQGTPEEVEDFLEGAPYDFDLEYVKKHNLRMDLKHSWQMHKPIGRSFIEKNAEKFTRVSVDWLNVEEQTLDEAISATHDFSRIFWEGYNRHYNAETGVFYFCWDNNHLPSKKSNSYTRHNLKRQGSGVPLTVIMSPTDEQTPYWNALEVVNQFKNGGYDATMISLEQGGHSGPDLSLKGANVKTDVTTRLGVHYDNVSIGWYLAVEKIYALYLTK